MTGFRREQAVMANRRTVAIVAAGAVAALLLCAIGYMLYGIFAPPPKDTVTVSEEEHRDFIARQARAARRTRTTPPDQPRAPLVPVAGIPWSRDVARPQVAVVYTASLPWTRQPGKPSPTLVAPATLPAMGATPPPMIEIPLELPIAFLPWRPVVSVSQAHVALATVPRLPKYRDASRPDPVMVEMAEIPWVRTLDGPLPGIVVEGALRGGSAYYARSTKVTGTGHWRPVDHHYYDASRGSARREGRAGEAEAVPLAGLPWCTDRDPAHPLVARVREAELPPMLKHLKPGR